MESSMCQRAASPVYDGTQALAVLGIRDHHLTKLRRRGLLPFYEANPRTYVYDSAQVDYLAAKARVAASHGHTRWDMVLAELCFQQRQYESCPPGVALSVRQNHAAVIIRRCRELVENGQATTMPMLVEALADVAAPRTIRGWITAGRIASVKIGATRYMSARYHRALVELMTKHIILPRAAEELNCPYTTLKERVMRGKPAGLCGPDGILRLSPRSMKELRKSQERKEFAIAGAASLLEVANKRRTSLNTGYEWLEAQFAASGRTPKTIPAKQACARLGIGAATLTLWSQEQLLPYFVRNVGERITHQVRDYVAFYIFGLVRFAGGGKVAKQQASEYKRRCAEVQVIV